MPRRFKNKMITITLSRYLTEFHIKSVCFETMLLILRLNFKLAFLADIVKMNKIHKK
jgi:hypothetical protein